MYYNITLQGEFAMAKNPKELIKTLKKYKKEGVKVVYSYGYTDITIERLIQRVEALCIEGFDLEEMYRQIAYELH
jgi:UDP-2,3-diacylglucosamine pyrophosphatase LpxH